MKQAAPPNAADTAPRSPKASAAMIVATNVAPNWNPTALNMAPVAPIRCLALRQLPSKTDVILNVSEQRSQISLAAHNECRLPGGLPVLQCGVSVNGLRDAQAKHPKVDSHFEIGKHIDMKRDYSDSIPDEWKAMSRVFSALGDEHRQRILLLFDHGERLNAGQVAEVSTLSRSAVSHHLKILREAKVLESQKLGKEVYFWINRPWLEEVLGNVLDYIRTSA